MTTDIQECLFAIRLQNRLIEPHKDSNNDVIKEVKQIHYLLVMHQVRLIKIHLMKHELDNTVKDFLKQINSMQDIQSDTRVGHLLFLRELKVFENRLKEFLKKS